MVRSASTVKSNGVNEARCFHAQTRRRLAVSQAININRLASALAYKKKYTNEVVAHDSNALSYRPIYSSVIGFKGLEKAPLTRPIFSEAKTPDP